MRARRRHGFTLIELLIVVAMIALLSLATLSFVTVPAQEQAIATGDLEAEASLALLFANLTGDVHNSEEIAHVDDRIDLRRDNEDGSIEYALRDGIIFRSVMRGDDAATSEPMRLAARVQGWHVSREIDSSFVHIEVRVATNDAVHPEIVRQVDLKLGVNAP